MRFSTAALMVLTMCSSISTHGTSSRSEPLVRLAELAIEPDQLDNYKVLLREEIDTSIRVESGVLALYAVSVRGEPTQIRLFEMYADAAAYEAHLRSAHFLKYKTGTRGMVKSLRLLETDTVMLGAKTGKRLIEIGDASRRSPRRDGRA